MKKRHDYSSKLVALGTRVVKFVLASHLLTALLVLCAVGFWAGTQARPAPGTVPFDEMFENLSVLTYRDAPSDSTARFVVELAARGRVFRHYDIDSRRFLDPEQGHDYRRSITGTRYRPLNVRGHVNRGFWFELPSAPTPALRSDQFDELYRTTLDYLKPVSITAAVVGALSGYSTGYRMAIWGGSLGNPKVQDRVFATPGIERTIVREAWKRVLLEPIVVGHERDARRFASVQGTQRIYTNFFRLALNDSDSFIPREAARLDSAGRPREARTMLAFARAVKRAAQDTCHLASEDFAAIEEWASLLEGRGHWARGVTPPSGEERMKYLGTLAWYGVAPAPSGEQRLWIGPRVLVRVGDMEGFVADEIPLNPVGCPIAWREWLRDDGTGMSENAWTAQYMGNMKQFMPLVQAGRSVSQWLGGRAERRELVRLARQGLAPRGPASRSNERATSDSVAAGRAGVSGARSSQPPSATDSERQDSTHSMGALEALGLDSGKGAAFAAQRGDSARKGAESKGHSPDHVKGEEVGARFGPVRE